MQQDIRNSGASSSPSTISSSFTTYSSQNLADIAARVVHELNLSHDDLLDDFLYTTSSSDHHHNDTVLANNVNNDEDDEGGDADDDLESEFAFAILCEEDTSSSIITADEIFHNGQIKPIYPFFSQNDGVSSSSSEGGEVERVPQGAYCVWAPMKEEEKEISALKKKSKSTGSGSPKRWRLRDLVHRSNSDGKDTFVFLNNNNGGGVKRREKVTAVNGAYYSYNKGGKKMEEMKKKTYLPYRQDLVGLFSTVNGFSRTIHPF
ncbi:uncharacterized protein LOC141655460 [Silene latifolia]|uniref:uncharacterized protein LOC141655460 n=1 Tax=Silene latifolia TaxID=37657 RepID=UPI003D76BB82